MLRGSTLARGRPNNLKLVSTFRGEVQFSFGGIAKASDDSEVLVDLMVRRRRNVLRWITAEYGAATATWRSFQRVSW